MRRTMEATVATPTSEVEAERGDRESSGRDRCYVITNLFILYHPTTTRYRDAHSHH